MRTSTIACSMPAGQVRQGKLMRMTFQVLGSARMPWGSDSPPHRVVHTVGEPGSRVACVVLSGLVCRTEARNWVAFAAHTGRELIVFVGQRMGGPGFPHTH